MNMDKQAIADITFSAWRMSVAKQDHLQAKIYENHLLALGYLPLCVEGGYILLQDKNPLPNRLHERYRKAARKLHWFEGLEHEQRIRIARALDDVATRLHAYGRIMTLAWIDIQLPYEQEFHPYVARVLSSVKAHLIRNPRENGD